MTQSIQIRASAVTISRGSGQSMDELVFGTVRRLLEAGETELSAVDAVVTVGSDVLDGVLVPTRAEIAGSAGRSYMNVPSASGQAILACDALIRSGQAGRVLLAGWGNLAKFGAEDPRTFQADPFYARPVGATPRALADLQTSQLCDRDLLSASGIAAYSAEMQRRAWPDGASGDALGNEGVAAILLTADDGAWPALRWLGSSTRAYVPRDQLLDPHGWTREAAPDLAADDGNTPYHVAGPHPAAEMRAMQALSGGAVDPDLPRLNPGGGGAARDFGPATGLALLAEAADALRNGTCSRAVFADLAGPLGQMISVFTLSQEPRA